MPTHQAAGPMLGYLYQVRFALYLLLEQENANFQISIEKFDDVAFSEDGTPKELIQLKHHVTQASLTDSSTDLWRTLKVWIDTVSEAPNLLDETIFLIITTATAPENTIASYLKKDESRDTGIAYNRLKEIAATSENRVNKKYYEAFTAMDDKLLSQLIDSIYVLDAACDIQNVEHSIRKQIRYACMPEHEWRLMERLEGWWFKLSINALCSDSPIYITQKQVRDFIVNTGQEYTSDNLPIEEFFIEIPENDLSKDMQIFYEQLKLIALGSESVNIALRDYLRAYKQRASWVRQKLLYINDLDKYEERLISEWQFHFAIMSDRMKSKEDTSEPAKTIHGQELYDKIQSKNIPIRSKCNEPFVMRGSYHILSTQLKVGWHIDFLERLKQLLYTHA